MAPDASRNRVDAFFGKIKNNPLLAVIIVAGVVIIALGSFTDAIIRLKSILPHRSGVVTDPAGLTAPIARDSLQQKYFSRFSTPVVRLDLAKLWYGVQWKDHFSQERSRKILVLFGRNMLMSADTNAILFVTGDEDFYPLVYAQEREYFRSSIAVVHFYLLRLPGYRDYVFERLGLRPPEPDVDYDVMVQQILRESPRPKFFSVTVGNDPVLESGRHLTLEGLAWRYESSITDGPHIDARVTEDLLQDRFDLSDILDTAGHLFRDLEIPIRTTVTPFYGVSFADLASQLSREGRIDAASRYRKIALALNPELR